MSQREAIATAFGWDIAEVEEYNPSRRIHSRTFLYQTGSGYVIAIKTGTKIPMAYNHLAPWVLRDQWKGWSVLESSDAMRTTKEG